MIGMTAGKKGYLHHCREKYTDYDGARVYEFIDIPLQGIFVPCGEACPICGEVMPEEEMSSDDTDE